MLITTKLIKMGNENVNILFWYLGLTGFQGMNASAVFGKMKGFPERSKNKKLIYP